MMGASPLVVELGVNLDVNLNTSFRDQDCLKRNWKHGISDCIHILPIVLRVLAALQFNTNYYCVLFGTLYLHPSETELFGHR